MGLFKAIGRQILKVIQWKDDSNNLLVHRYEMTDRDEIMNGCQLVVNEGQMVILTKEGKLADVFGPGTHKLETKNLPILTKIASWKYGFDSPFKADVYYINTKQFINQKWGTSNPVMLRDADFGMIRIRAFGKYAFRVNDGPTLLRQIVGTTSDYTVDNLKDHFKTMFVSSFSDAVASSKVSALDIASRYEELAIGLKDSLNPAFVEMGIELSQVYVENVSLPQEVEEALDKRTSLGILGDKMGTYVAMETVGAMRDAASNPNGSGLAGAGVGVGVGVGMAGMMMNNLKDVQDTTPTKPIDANNKVEEKGPVCPKCGAQLAPGAKFCSECGEKMPVAQFCSECGEKVAPGAKFCPNCGHKLV